MGLLDPICHGMWSLTPYDKCDYRCLYCCTGVQGRSKPSVAPEAMLPLLRDGLARLPRHDLVILGAFCDGYPLVEADLGLTRPIIRELIAQARRFVVVTKGTTVLRDLDLLVQARPGTLLVTVSLSSTDDEVLRRLDPMAPPASARLRVLRALWAAGIWVDVNALPWIPDVTDTAAILAAVPPGVPVVFSPLATGVDRDSLQLLGRRFERREVWTRYLEEYRRFGHLPNTSWVEPRLPPTENDPNYRLPRLPAPAAPSSPAAAPRWRTRLAHLLARHAA